jgi:hypothetical protein
MPADSPEKQPAVPRSRVVEVIERTQEDAMRKLQQAGIPEQHALMTMQRISSFCLQTLRELDLLYRQFEELVEQQPDRSPSHQRFLTEKAYALLLQVESGIAALVAEAINKAKEDYRQQLSHPREVLPVVPKPSRPGWLAGYLPTVQRLVWVAGMVSGLVLAWQFSASYVLAGIGFLIPFALWRLCGRRWWGLLFPLAGIGLEAWALSWLILVEG